MNARGGIARVRMCAGMGAKRASLCGAVYDCVSVSVCVALCALIAAAPSHARRLAAPGGKVTVALPGELVARTIDAHVDVSFVEPAFSDDPAMALAHPALPGFPMWRSSVLTRLVPDDDGRAWTLSATVPAATAAEALTRCLVRPSSESWPAAVLKASKNAAEVTAVGLQVRVRFSSPFWPVPDLLAGCALRSTSPTGSYAPAGPGVLGWRAGGLGPSGLPGLIEVTGPGTRADIVAGGAEGPDTITVLAPYPDVVLLVPTSAARARDPLGLLERDGGRRMFARALRADLLAAAYGQGRGAPTETVLPPGVAPARPLPPPAAGVPQAPLTLAPLPQSAPTLAVERESEDALVAGVVERLAVILRNRGIRTELVAAPRPGATDGGVRILRWRPPTADPALALLALAGTYPQLAVVETAARVLVDPRLVAASAAERTTAALALERAWLEAAAVVPLLTVDRWFVVDPDLRGMQVRDDGVPLLHGVTFAVGAGLR